MNTGAFGENFPYSNFHDLNMDWIIKIAKDFLDQYTHLEELIETGKADITALTEQELGELQDKYDNLSDLLQAAYEGYNTDLANQLAQAIADLNAWYASHLTTFMNAIDTKVAEVLQTIPSDYTALSNKVNALETLTGDNLYVASTNNLTWTRGYIREDGTENTQSPSFVHCTTKLDISTKKIFSILCPLSYQTVFFSLYQDNTFVRNFNMSNDNPLCLLPDDGNKIVVNIYFGQSTEPSAVSTTLITLTRNPYLTEKTVQPIVDASGLVDLINTNELEMGSYNSTTGTKQVSTTLCRNKFPIAIPTGTKINLVPLKHNITNFHMFEYNEDGRFIKYTAVDSIPTTGEFYYTTSCPIICFEFFVGAGNLDIANTFFRAIAHIRRAVFSGKKLSVLGDSISTFDGVSDHNTAYYPTGNIYVSGQIYWGLVAGDMELTIDQVNAYGGSTVSLTNNNPMCVNTRLDALGSPDFIIFEGGVNDIYSNRPSGTWEGIDLDNLTLSNFIPAYTKCLYYMQQHYPNATIIAISPSLIGGATDTFRQYCTIENTDRIIENEKLVCERLGVKFIDCRNLIMNLGNIDNYTIDKMHYNYQYMQYVARAIENLMK